MCNYGDNLLLLKEYKQIEEIQWCLEAVSDVGKELTINIESLPFVMGRESDCDLKLIDKRISRHHCELRISSNMLWIRDLGSTNGTFINKKRSEQAELLEPNDIISIGDYEFKVKRNETSASDTTHTSLETICSTLSKEIKDLSSFAANERIEEAKETGATAIVSCCPFCLNQFKNNIKNDEIQALDLSELVKRVL